MSKPKTLTLKERRFVDAYLGSAAGNGTAAARTAGYKGSPKVLGVQSARMLGKASVKAAVAARVQKAEAKGIASAEERDLRLSEILRMTDAELGHVIAAVRELNKCTGRHSITHNVQGKLTLEQALGESRAE